MNKIKCEIIKMPLDQNCENAPTWPLKVIKMPLDQNYENTPTWPLSNFDQQSF